MPNKKKGSSKKGGGKPDKRDFRRNASHFRSLLQTARQDYAKGRSFAAVELQKQALQFGSQNLPRFEHNSLTKAHALLELGLARSAICTDFVSGTEWDETRDDMNTCLQEAMQIYHDRLAQGTLTTFRKEEVWIRGNAYESAVPHTERLGPVDYVTCANMAAGTELGSRATIAVLKKALQFVETFRQQNCMILLEDGGGRQMLQGEVPVLDSIRENIARQEQEIITGAPVTPEEEDLEEVRHTGTRLGKMKLSREKLARDVEKKGLRGCGYAECDKMEHHPREFSTCSGCKWVPYCSREHQVKDWPVHKKLCKTVCTQRRKEFEESKTKANKNTHLLMGRAQLFLTIVAHLHYFFVQAPETKPMMSAMNPFVTAKLQHGPEDHRKLSMQEIGFVWYYRVGLFSRFRLD